jgi:hypothetical protein
VSCANANVLVSTTAKVAITFFMFNRFNLFF